MVVGEQIFWNENGELMSIATEDSFFVLKYKVEAVERAKSDKQNVSEDGVEDAFEVLRLFSRERTFYLKCVVFFLERGCFIWSVVASF